MKYAAFLFLMAGIFYACDKNDNDYIPVNEDPDLLGTWNLIEVYADPGGGGAFQPVESDKQINFQADGIISSNGDLCSMSIEANNFTSGRFTLIDSTFSSPDCNDPDYDYKFEYSGNILIITYPCIEPCQMKYEKE